MKEIIGIIGGIGPYAGIDMVQKIFDNTLAQKDNDHLPVILYSIPQIIPNRTKYIKGGSKNNPAHGIIEAIQDLAKVEAYHIAVACNAAHSPVIWNEVQQWTTHHSHIHLYNIVEETIKYLKINLPKINKVSVLSVEGTYKSRVFDSKFEKAGIDTITVPIEIQQRVHNAVWDEKFGIKSFSNPVTRKARNELFEIIESVSAMGAEGIILGCTEIPLAIPEYNFKNIPLIDPSEILARSIINNTTPDKLMPDPLITALS